MWWFSLEFLEQGCLVTEFSLLLTPTGVPRIPLQVKLLAKTNLASPQHQSNDLLW